MANKNLVQTKNKKTAVEVAGRKQPLSQEKNTSADVAALQLPAMPGMALQIMRQLESYIRQSH